MLSSEADLRSVRARVVGAALVTTVVAIPVFLQLPTSDWRTACVLFLCKDLVYAVYAIRFHDLWVQRILLFLAILTGFNFVEDWLLVACLKVTHYNLPESHPPTIWHTPVFGLLAWPAMAMELAILGAWLVGRLRWLGVLAACSLGMTLIPCYDELALRLHWWRYDNARLFLHTPYFVIVSESLLAGAIAWAALALQQVGSLRVLRIGVMVGIYLLAITYLSYRLL